MNAKHNETEISNFTDNMTLKVNSRDDMRKMFNQLASLLEKHPKLILTVNKTHYTLSHETWEHLKKTLEDNIVRVEVDSRMTGATESDMEIVRSITHKGEVTVSVPKGRTAERKWTRRDGEFFPYTHDFECEELSTELASLGCWRAVEHVMIITKPTVSITPLKKQASHPKCFKL